MLQLAIESGKSEDSYQVMLPIEQGEQNIEPEDKKEDGANDIFKHTFVDILDDDKKKPANEVQNEKPEKVMNIVEQPVKQPKEIFYFYNFSFDLPTEYYKQLGDFSVVNRT